MSWLLEEPWTVIGLGLFAELLLGVAFFKTRRGVMLVAMGGVVLAVASAVLLEWFVVTEREAVENTIYAAAEAAEAGDAEKLLSYVAPDAVEVRTAVRHYLGWVDLTSVSINALEVSFEGGSAKRAVARFSARVSLTSKSVDLTRTEYLFPMEVTLRKEGDQWLVTAHEFLQPGQGQR
jgi:ketosteroid isomerase-like protein